MDKGCISMSLSVEAGAAFLARSREESGLRRGDSNLEGLALEL